MSWSLFPNDVTLTGEQRCLVLVYTWSMQEMAVVLATLLNCTLVGSFTNWLKLFTLQQFWTSLARDTRWYSVLNHLLSRLSRFMSPQMWVSLGSAGLLCSVAASHWARKSSRFDLWALRLFPRLLVCFLYPWQKYIFLLFLKPPLSQTDCRCSSSRSWSCSCSKLFLTYTMTRVESRT